MRKLIKVTKKHIKDGAILDSTRCPIALAILDSGFASPRVCNQFISLNNPDEICGVSRSIKRFIKKFDKGCNVEPFNFYIEVE